MSIGHNGGPSGNWVAIDRAIIEHHIVGAGQPVPPADPSRGAYSRLESWLDLITLAAYTGRRISSHGVTVILEPGQTLAGRTWLAARWNWTEKTVRGWLKRLESELMITLACEGLKTGQTKGHLPNVITICNWSKFQNPDATEGPPSGPPEGHLGATQGPPKGHTLTNKQINKETKRSEEREERELVLTADAVPVSLEVVGAFEAYNDLAQRVGLPVARTLTPQRRKAIAARMREHGGQGAWARMLANIERSAFLQGRNSRNWTPPGLDWFLTPANFTKVCEGSYGNGAHANQTSQPSESYLERMRRLMGTSQDAQDYEVLNITEGPSQ